MTIKEKINIYTQILLKWNKIHNLGGNLTQDLIKEYIDDSIFPLEFIQNFNQCIDVGSGAGFPAIPLAIYCPHSLFILTEPRKKRYAFLQYICMELQLNNVTIEKKRIEQLASLQVDLITSRALMNTQKLIILTQRFLKNNGYYLFYKGSNLAQEISKNSIDSIQKKNRIYFYERKQN